MTAYLITGNATRIKLPELLEWELDYGCGSPCDSFRVVCLWNDANNTPLGDMARFEAIHDGELVFSGVVDECEVSLSTQGCVLEVNGRGMAALLLDNEAQGTDYDVATIEDILRGHVLPYGIQVVRQAAFPAVERFCVTHGSSEWSVLYQFARYHADVAARFDRQGRLVLSPWPQEVSGVLDERVPVTALRETHKRYGVLSEIWVREAGKAPAVQRVVNEAFRAAGGCCRRMFTMPGKSNYQSMRYQGEYQLALSRKEQNVLRLDVAVPFYAQPGELIRLDRKDRNLTGVWRVKQATVTMDGTGYGTRLELVPPDTML